MFEDILKRFSKEHAFLKQEKLLSMYQIVNEQIEQNNKDTAVWTKAFVDAEGDPQKQKAIYIGLMVERLILAEAVLLEKKKKVQRVERAEGDKRNNPDRELKDRQNNAKWSDYPDIMAAKEEEKKQRINTWDKNAFEREEKFRNKNEISGSTLKSYHKKQTEAEEKQRQERNRRARAEQEKYDKTLGYIEDSTVPGMKDSTVAKLIIVAVVVIIIYFMAN